ncbi:MAG TPA: LysE family transporter [Candidatus Dormibacteraeota bacterium]|nr:LysE family transporter [Candidatus Dormibacteraeota bacterium]
MARALALGFLVGFPIALSPGPTFFLVLRRTLARRWRSGFVSGLGVATGDATYAALGAFGIAAVTTFLLAERRSIGLTGGIAIALIGLRTLLRRESPHPALPRERGRGNGVTRNLEGSKEFVSILALTLSNPSTILPFTAVFAGLGIHVAGGWSPALALVVGEWLGSLALVGCPDRPCEPGFGLIAVGAALAA